MNRAVWEQKRSRLFDGVTEARLPLIRSAALFAVGCVVLTGCFDTKEEYTLNPDGSGKVVVESRFLPISEFL